MCISTDIGIGTGAARQERSRRPRLYLQPVNLDHENTKAMRRHDRRRYHPIEMPRLLATPAVHETTKDTKSRKKFTVTDQAAALRRLRRWTRVAKNLEIFVPS